MTPADIARIRLHNQRLSDEPFESAADVVRWLVAVQAQDYAGAKWALRLRMRNATDEALDRAFAEGSIVRTHVLRPTWHFVAPEDIRWLLMLTAPRVHKVNGTMYRKLELDEPTLSSAGEAIVTALEGGRLLTRNELAGELKRSGIAEPGGLRLAYMMMHAELEGLICSGPRRGKQFTYALLDERVPFVKTLDRDEALDELARRYFMSRGPATVHDFAKWSGLTVRGARAGLDGVKVLLEREKMGGQTYWFRPPSGMKALPPSNTPRATRALMLSIYDEYISGYKDRSAIGDSRDMPLMMALGNALTYVIVIDGRIVGTWRRTINSRDVDVEINPFAPLSAVQERAVAAALDDYGAFLGLNVVRV